MKRLTRWNNETEQPELVRWDEEEWKGFMNIFDVPVWMDLLNAVDKLAHYEDLEEKGLLIKLPCKIGTPIYMTDSKCEGNPYECNQRCYECEFKRPCISEGRFDFDWLGTIGECVFLTKEEAEEALRKKVDE